MSHSAAAPPRVRPVAPSGPPRPVDDRLRRGGPSTCIAAPQPASGPRSRMRGCSAFTPRRTVCTGDGSGQPGLRGQLCPPCHARHATGARPALDEIGVSGESASVSVALAFRDFPVPGSAILSNGRFRNDGYHGAERRIFIRMRRGNPNDVWRPAPSEGRAPSRRAPGPLREGTAVSASDEPRRIPRPSPEAKREASRSLVLAVIAVVAAAIVTRSLKSDATALVGVALAAAIPPFVTAAGPRSHLRALGALLVAVAAMVIGTASTAVGDKVTGQEVPTSPLGRIGGGISLGGDGGSGSTGSGSSSSTSHSASGGELCAADNSNACVTVSPQSLTCTATSCDPPSTCGSPAPRAWSSAVSRWSGTAPAPSACPAVRRRHGAR